MALIFQPSQRAQESGDAVGQDGVAGIVGMEAVGHELLLDAFHPGLQAAHGMQIQHGQGIKRRAFLDNIHVVIEMPTGRTLYPSPRGLSSFRR